MAFDIWEKCFDTYTWAGSSIPESQQERGQGDLGPLRESAQLWPCCFLWLCLALLLLPSPQDEDIPFKGVSNT